MRALALCTLSLLVVVAMPIHGQTASSMPSADEIFELVDKADQKVSTFEEAVKAVRPSLDAVDPKAVKTYLQSASTAHSLIASLHKNGISAYRLVSLLVTLDDVSLNAQKAALLLATLNSKQATNNASVLSLASASTSCSDVAELIIHATLRFILTEETLLQNLSASKN